MKTLMNTFSHQILRATNLNHEFVSLAIISYENLQALLSI